jgi:ABC-type Fe3+ transport system substrate-binding protein
MYGSVYIGIVCNGLTAQSGCRLKRINHRHAAWQFLKFLLSDEIQFGDGSSDYYIENPVNKRAADMRFEQLREQVLEQAEIIK